MELLFIIFIILAFYHLFVEGVIVPYFEYRNRVRLIPMVEKMIDVSLLSKEKALADAANELKKMSPKEKATEIINECAVIVDNCGSLYQKEHTKECALMVVNQILKNDCGYNAYNGTLGNEYWMDRGFWDNVKLEIEGM